MKNKYAIEQFKQRFTAGEIVRLQRYVYKEKVYIPTIRFQEDLNWTWTIEEYFKSNDNFQSLEGSLATIIQYRMDKHFANFRNLRILTTQNQLLALHCNKHDQRLSLGFQTVFNHDGN